MFFTDDNVDLPTWWQQWGAVLGWEILSCLFIYTILYYLYKFGFLTQAPGPIDVHEPTISPSNIKSTKEIIEMSNMIAEKNDKLYDLTEEYNALLAKYNNLLADKLELLHENQKMLREKRTRGRSWSAVRGDDEWD